MIEFDNLTFEVYRFYEKMHEVARISCVSIGLPEGVFDDLSDDLTEDNDWSFVLKVVGLFEVCLAKLIIKEIGSELIYDNIVSLNLGGKSGKISLCKNLKLLNGERIKFLEALIVLRNYYAHDILNVGKTVFDYLEELKVNERRSWIDRICSINEVRKGLPSLGNEEKKRYIRNIIFCESVMLLNDIGKRMTNN
ncbi:hypothetical protein J2848_001000 [Azospirillum lipoferum]|uniref:DUF4145 domain-containing protein n=1 Tax=Azospirillum lipoferum TaxID=193 RepID=A0A5A9GW36_AZOLI|nr:MULTISPECIES: hypothetical protein [Azospirillum]KAA0598628.1 hypothetical protein FZ942_06050 [Azospirillum lipoferum]MCP1609353.1 hypothetical protein [Azospirillum lipoferum]MDW5535338.1 hypothetical protein [Azospirillum sp. NL1]